jgi:hypothetical protein
MVWGAKIIAVFIGVLGAMNLTAPTSRQTVLPDSFLGSGGDTSLEAAASDKPIITLPGPMMWGRHTPHSEPNRYPGSRSNDVVQLNSFGYRIRP